MSHHKRSGRAPAGGDEAARLPRARGAHGWQKLRRRAGHPRRRERQRTGSLSATSPRPSRWKEAGGGREKAVAARAKGMVEAMRRGGWARRGARRRTFSASARLRRRRVAARRWRPAFERRGGGRRWRGGAPQGTRGAARHGEGGGRGAAASGLAARRPSRRGEAQAAVRARP